MSDVFAARAAIADLVHTYALNIRRGDGAQCVELFTDDAVFEVREAFVGREDAARTRSRLVGRDAIVSYLARTSAPQARVCPFIHNLLIHVRGDEATSTCVMTSLVWFSGHQIIGEYQDTYRRDTEWRFSSRVFTMLGELAHTVVASNGKPQ